VKKIVDRCVQTSLLFQICRTNSHKWCQSVIKLKVQVIRLNLVCEHHYYEAQNRPSVSQVWHHCIQRWKFLKKIIRHQVWQALKVVSPDEKFPAQVLLENSSPETAKQAGHAWKQLGAIYRLKILVQGQGGIIVDHLCMLGWINSPKLIFTTWNTKQLMI